MVINIALYQEWCAKSSSVYPAQALNQIQNLQTMQTNGRTMHSTSTTKKPHAVCIPFPAQGHIDPMLKLAQILYSKGFHITFVHTEYNYNRLVRSKGLASMAGLPSFKFETIPDGLPPPPSADVTQDTAELCRSTEVNCIDSLRKLIKRLNDAGPKVSCIVADGVMFFALEAAEEVGVPGVLLWTASACGLRGYSKYRDLVEQGIIPLKDKSYITNGYLNSTTTSWTSSVEDIRLKDMTSFLRTTDPKDFLLNFVQRKIEKSRNAAAIILNTYDALEQDILNALAPQFPPLYPIGPFQLQLNRIKDHEDNSIPSLPSSLWKYDTNCLTWLDSKNPDSVVYISFGSITTMTDDNLIEFAWGLANSNVPFLWIIRPDLVNNSESSVLPPEFMEEIGGRGYTASWCDQEKVLRHPAVGGFLTHSGWNSTLESICNGVPMVCWPFFAEQHTNCWYCCSHWGIAMEINSDVKRDEIEKQVRELMVGNKGKEMKRNAAEWRRLAEDATTSPSGSSYLNLESLLHQVLLR